MSDISSGAVDCDYSALPSSTPSQLSISLLQHRFGAFGVPGFNSTTSLYFFSGCPLTTMQTLAHRTSCTGCGHRFAPDVAGSVKPIVARSTAAVQRKAERGDVRAEGAGSLVLSTLAAGVAAYYLSKHVDTVEQVMRVAARSSKVIAVRLSPLAHRTLGSVKEAFRGPPHSAPTSYGHCAVPQRHLALPAVRSPHV